MIPKLLQQSNLHVLQVMYTCKHTLQSLVQILRFAPQSTFFNSSDSGAGDSFVSLFLIYSLLANSHSNNAQKYHNTHTANTACLHEVQQTKWSRKCKGLHSVYCNHPPAINNSFPIKYVWQKVLHKFLTHIQYNCSFTMVSFRINLGQGKAKLKTCNLVRGHNFLHMVGEGGIALKVYHIPSFKSTWWQTPTNWDKTLC